MPKSSFAIAVDQIQRDLLPYLKEQGFKVRGRTLNRVGSDGCTHVVGIQMGASDPPGTAPIPSLRENLHGLFAINLGVFVPEVARLHPGTEPKSWIQDYHCCVRMRLGALIGQGKEVWWPAKHDETVVNAVQHALRDDGLPFIDRFATRDRILDEWRGISTVASAGRPPRIVSAIILCERGETVLARHLLSLQSRETRNPGHPAYVRSLAQKLGLGELEA